MDQTYGKMVIVKKYYHYGRNVVAVIAVYHYAVSSSATSMSSASCGSVGSTTSNSSGSSNTSINSSGGSGVGLWHNIDRSNNTARKWNDSPDSLR